LLLYKRIRLKIYPMKSKNSISDQEKIYWAAFYHLGIGGEKNIRCLVKKFGNLQRAWNYFCNRSSGRDAKFCVSTKLIEKIKNFSLEKLESDLERHKIGIIMLDSSEYPSRLKRIKNPPLVLYYKSMHAKFCVSEKGPILGVVGTRRGTSYGKQVLNYVLPDIVRRNVTVVSGLARGIDAHAHKITLDNDGKAIAVLAGGLDQIYPPEHTKFAEEIISLGSVLISEHPPGTQYLKQYFPARNRIVSGLSDAILVVEAKEKSGALITADFAFKQGRKVLAVPGSIFSGQSKGVNQIFKKGALPVQEPRDILEVFFGSGHVETQNFASLRQDEINLTSEERKILKYILFNRPVPLNNIIRKSRLSSAAVISIISQLEIKNLIESTGGGVNYIKIM